MIQARRIPAMVAKDLRRRWRSPLGTLILLAFPLVFAGLLALAFGSGDSNSLPKVPILIENHDEGLAGNLVATLFTAEQAGEFFEGRVVDAETGEGAALMEAGEASALLRIPEGFTDALLDGEPTRLELVKNPAESILPEVAEQTTRVLADAAGALSRLMQRPLSEVKPYFEDDAGPVSEAAVASTAVAFQRLGEHVEGTLFPPVMILETGTAGEGDTPEDDTGRGQTTTIFLFILPGVATFALFSLGDQIMRDLLVEAEEGTLRRQLQSPLTPGTLVASKVVTTVAVASVCLVVLATIAWLAGGRGSLPGFLALSAALILAVTGAAALIYGFAGNQSTGATFASIIYLVLAFAGGSFVPLDNLPGVVQRLAPVSPFYWSTRGFQELLLNDAGLGEVLPHVGILAGLGIALLVVGSWSLGRRVIQGKLA